MRNPTYDQVLTSEGVEYDYAESVALADINTTKGLRNQARLEEPLDQQLVEQYAAAMQGGIEFPPVVLWRPGRGMWVPVDGNQRLAAHEKAKHKATDAYLLKTTDEQVVDRLTWRFNNLVNGKRLTASEALEHAISFVRKYGLEHKVAAKEWGVNAVTLSKEIRVREAKDVLAAHNVKVTPTLTNDHLNELNPLRKIGDDVFARAAKVVGGAGVTREDVGELTRKMAAARTTETKLKVLDDFEKSDLVKGRRAETKGGQIKNVGTPPRDRHARLIKELLHLLEDYPEKAAIRRAGKLFEEDREVIIDVVDRWTILYGLGARPAKGVS